MFSIFSKIKSPLLKTLAKALAVFLVLGAIPALAHANHHPEDLSGLVDKVLIKQVSAFGRIALTIAWVSGFCFCIGGLYLLRQQRENPVQIHLNKPIFALAIGGALIFLPKVIELVGKSVLNADNMPTYIDSRLNSENSQNQFFDRN
ncbi:MAG: DUF6750 family protein [Gammaproteobacteria bacterium]